ncbi:MAG: hypothetical protein OJF49_004213 [Ktedonobacterales bacterium]|jgi:uncharacterized membrane protein YeaQ/YmgE (transglycosylase-associated protein family)|nr:MAG: hypothetical protein OJF49_004213 [Ktedonobacterales bacterium]
MVLSSITNIQFIPNSGFLDQLFHQTSVTIQILGLLKPAFYINLIQLIIILIIAIAVNAIAERLTSKKVGGLLAATIITLIGSYLCTQYVKLGFDFSLEGVRIVAALLGAIVIGVFYTLIRGQVSSEKKKSS